MSDEDLVRKLKDATSGLMMMSESDYPFEVVRWEDAEKVSPEYLRRKASVESDVPIMEQSVEDFFMASAREPENAATEGDVSERFRKLVALLTTTLDEARVYRLGDINICVYILGRSRHSTNMVGVSTRVVET